MGVGGEQAMLLLPLRAPVFRRSNRHLHHRLADACASTIERHAGERAISASVRGNTVFFLAEEKLRRGACGTLARPLPGACVTGGIRTRICHGAKYPRSSPPASVEPRDAANRSQTNKILSRRSERCAAIANPFWFALPSVSGSSPRSLRQAPRAWAHASAA
jgi:hypothetical protein